MLYVNGHKQVIGGGAGHTIKNDSGTSLNSRNNLQFKGTYSKDNSTSDATEIEITREMTAAQYALLSAEEKKGIINVTDEAGNEITANDITYDNTSSGLVADDVQDAIDELHNTSNITLTGDRITDIAGLSFVKDGIAYICGFFTTTDAIPANAKLGEFNISCKSPGGQWIGIDIESEKFVRGYISANGLYRSGSFTIPNEHNVSIISMFEISNQ